MLWLTMLSMANAKTGELRHREHWYCGGEIDRRAEISKRTRLKFMNELLRVGLVRMERERTEGVLTDRRTGQKRWRSGVLGEVHYFVFKSPRKDWFSNAAEPRSPRKHCGPSTVQSSEPLESCNTPNKTEDQPQQSAHKQRVSTTVQFDAGGKSAPTSTSVVHPEGSVGVTGRVADRSNLGGSTGDRVATSTVGTEVENRSKERDESSSVSGKTLTKEHDDDSSLSYDPPDRIEMLLERARNILVSSGHDREFVRAALDLIEQRAVDWGKAPATVQYYLSAFEVLMRSTEDCFQAKCQAETRKARYAKFGIALDPEHESLPLTPGQEKARAEFNLFHQKVAANDPTAAAPSDREIQNAGQGERAQLNLGFEHG